MGRLHIMGTTGDIELEWTDTDHREAKREFNKLLKAGYWAYTVTGEGTGEVLRKFDPTAEKVIVSVPLVGG